MHHIFEQHKGPITRLKFANDESTRLAIASEDGSLSICHVNDDPNKSMVGLILHGHTKGISGDKNEIFNVFLIIFLLIFF